MESFTASKLLRKWCVCTFGYPQYLTEPTSLLSGKFCCVAFPYKDQNNDSVGMACDPLWKQNLDLQKKKKQDRHADMFEFWFQRKLLRILINHTKVLLFLIA